MKNPLVAVIVTFNRLSYLKTTIQKSLEFGFDKIIVVNNASNDGTIDYLKDLSHDEIKVLNLPKNIGGAGGFYEGLKFVKENYQAGYTCLFDDDSFPNVSREVVEKNIEKLGDKVGCMAASVFLPDGNISEMNRVALNPFKSLKVFLSAVFKGRQGFHLYDHEYHGETREIDTSSFVGCFVNIASLHKAKVMPHPGFFIYADDVLFTYQMKEAGFKNYFVPEIKFIHDCYSYDDKVVYTALWKIYFLYRNNCEMYTHVAKWLFPIAFIRSYLIWRFRARHYGELKGCYLMLLRLAIKDFFLRRFDKDVVDIRNIIETYKENHLKKVQEVS